MIAAAALLLLQAVVVPDSVQLRQVAVAANVPYAVVAAIALEETGANLSPTLRGHYCWYGYKSLVVNPVSNGIDTVRVVHHEKDCEVGRFQIKPSTAKGRCVGLNIWTYDGNIACFTKMFGEDTRRLGVIAAITKHNGSGLKAREYTQRVLATVGRIVLTSEYVDYAQANGD